MEKRTPATYDPEIIIDTDLARGAIEEWKKTLGAGLNDLGTSAHIIDQGDLEFLQRQIVQAIRAAKKHTVESCGFAYYEVKKEDYTNPKVLGPILMDRRRVLLQFVDENLSSDEMRETVQKWTEALRAKTEYVHPAEGTSPPDPPHLTSGG